MSEIFIPGEPKKEQDSGGIDKALFRWMMFLLITVASKVLNKEEVMGIYVLVSKAAGHSLLVDQFHTQLLSFMEHLEEKKDE